MSSKRIKVSVGMLAIMSILTVMLPAIALYYVNEYSLNTLEIAVEHGEFSSMHSGEFINVFEQNKTMSTVEIFDVLRTIGWAPISIGILPTVDQETILARNQGWLEGIGDYVTTFNNTNYALFPSYYIGEPPGGNADWVLHRLELTTHNITKYNALIINSNDTHGDIGFVFPHVTGMYYPIYDIAYNSVSIDNDTYLVGIPNQVKLELLALPDKPVWLYYWDLNLTDVDYTFSIEIADTSGIFTIEPLILTMIILLFISTVLTIFTAFYTDFIDIKFGK